LDNYCHIAMLQKYV